MGSLTLHRIARGAVGLLIVIVLRALGEFLRIGACGATALSPEGKLYLTGAMAAAAAALVAFALHAMDRDRVAIGVTAVSILGLLTYKIVALA
jgi:hypothetical protein